MTVMNYGGVRLRLRALMERGSRANRYFSEGKGKVLSEEERAVENVYIQKMERERTEKLKKKAEKESIEKDNQEKKPAEAGRKG